LFAKVAPATKDPFSYPFAKEPKPKPKEKKVEKKLHLKELQQLDWGECARVCCL